MVRVRSLFIGMAAAGLLLVGSRAEGSSSASVRYGVVEADSGTMACLRMAGPRLPEGTVVFVIFDDPQTMIEAVVGAVDSGCAERALMEGSSYSLTLGVPFDLTPAVGIAVLAPGAKAVLERGALYIRTRGVRTPLTFATCTSSEGLHLTAWRGSRRVWHQYYYLGYDVEPDCTEKETQ